MKARVRRGALALIVMMALAAGGCTLDTAPLGAGADPAIERAAAANQLAALQAAQAAALELWDRLIAGEAVSCREAITLPPPLAGRAATVQVEQVLAQVSAARTALEQSAARWDMECGYPGDIVGLDAARVGRDTARQASEPLRAAQALLEAWPPP